jgi:lysophospholipase L1-like esterase
VLDAFVAQVQTGGGEVVTVMPARLSESFGGQHRVARDNQGWESWLAKAGVRNVRLWEAWAGQDPAALALDEVHLDADGHAALAVTLDALVAPAFERWEASR